MLLHRLPGAALALALLLATAVPPATAQATGAARSPAEGATDVPPDTQLKLSFAAPPTVGTRGRIRIVDAASGQVVDTLDLAIPSSPNPTGRAPEGTLGRPASAAAGAFQVNRIGGRDFHFRPVIVRGNTATITPHNGALAHGRRYRVTLEPGVLQAADGSFAGIGDDAPWTFSTRAAPPPPGSTRLVVAADGSGDFSTVQGAIDFVPERPPQRVTIFIRNGRYEELVSLNKKSNLVLRGESRDGVQVGYANNSAFNPRNRWAFSIVDGSDIQLSTFTITNHAIGQAEALMTRGQRIVLDRMSLHGSGDALTTYGTLYVVDSLLTGHGDTVLGYAAAYFLRTEVRSIGPFTWTRTPEGSHGNVFVECTLVALDQPLPWTVSATDPGRKVRAVLARLPRNTSAVATATNFPHAEMVLIDTRTDGIAPEGWGPIEAPPGFDASKVRFWEYNTMDRDGRPLDLSQRHPVARRLTLEHDAETIANYRRPAFVLGGWTPVVE
ncbi:MAG: carbohydrate esterase [Burkholderiales bacterium]|nr:carbohydrate esterase [Burkholderiales bacterium]